MDTEDEFRSLIRRLAGAMTTENLKMIKYLCKDLSNISEFTSSIALFEHFEDKGWIGFSDLSFLAEILYRINRHDLLKLFPNVKNRKDYEQNYLPNLCQNFTPFRIACFQLTGELTKSDFEILKNFCKNKLSGRNYNRSNDIFTLLECLEEEDLLSDGDSEFILNSLRHLDNQAPYKLFQQLSLGKQQITHPHQSKYNSQVTTPMQEALRSLPNLNLYPEYQVTHCQYPSVPNLAGFHQLSRDKVIENEQTIPKPTSYLSMDGTTNHSDLPHANSAYRAFDEDDQQSSKMQFELSKSFMTPEGNQEDIKTHSTEGCFTPAYLEESNCQFLDPVSCRAGFDVADSYSSESLLHSVEGSHNETVPPGSAVSLSDVAINPSEHPVHANIGLSRSLRLQIDHYQMYRRPVGICLIINNVSFESSVNIPEARRRYQMKGHDYPVPNVGLKDRIGSKLDVERASKLFADFGFKIELHENLDSRSMQKVLMSVAKRDHSRYDCFLLIIMSHGSLGSVYGIDGMPIRCVDIKSYFKPVSAPTLLNKPKILMFQACQGDQSMDGHAAPIDDIETDGPLETTQNTTTPSEADFLICYSTVPGYISYRSRSKGSFFISRVVENLRTLYNTEDVLSIMANVNAELARESLNQMAMPISTLRKKVYFAQH